MIYVDTSLQPLCPQSFAPMHPLHQQSIDAQNKLYDAMAFLRDDDSEVAPQYEGIASALNDENMRLYVSNAYAIGHRARIEAWFFRCLVCGFVLPANRED